ncbi:hypothetical protein SAMN05216386_2588 [Nitrosospira briensis]|uniref:Uncharacterized protein n=1 Tax=Nitrosospira briensis TaxID=35799 RepID=A0A1I5ECG1_9PROT|nr:hypothetical protein SAMN05216386_2588 [Nitrosospira briensis]
MTNPGHARRQKVLWSGGIIDRIPGFSIVRVPPRNAAVLEPGTYSEVPGFRK